MLSLLGSVLGFGTSFLPKIMDYFQDRQDKAHELEVMTRQMELQLKLQEAGATQKLEEINVDADIREQEALLKHDSALTRKASTFMVNFSASVRPMVSYMLFAEFFTLTFLLAFDAIDLEFYKAIWNEPMQAVFATVTSFYFGSRSFNRKNHT